LFQILQCYRKTKEMLGLIKVSPFGGKIQFSGLIILRNMEMSRQYFCLTTVLLTWLLESLWRHQKIK
jgi:hypothetical protein